MMAHYDARLYTDKGIEILNTKIECTPENIPDMLASVVLDYLKDAPYPGVIKAGVTDNRHHMEYTLRLENNALHAYLHVKKAVGGGGTKTAPAPRLLQGSSEQGGGGPMTRYDVRLYTNNGAKISNKKIECNGTEISDMLACTVLDYLRDAPYPGAIKAHVITGRTYTEYILLLKNDALDVCLHVLQADRAEVQELLDREEPAR